jgi:hypothetical protein
MCRLRPEAPEARSQESHIRHLPRDKSMYSADRHKGRQPLGTSLQSGSRYSKINLTNANVDPSIYTHSQYLYSTSVIPLTLFRHHSKFIALVGSNSKATLSRWVLVWLGIKVSVQPLAYVSTLLWRSPCPSQGQYTQSCCFIDFIMPYQTNWDSPRLENWGHGNIIICLRPLSQ